MNARVRFLVLWWMLLRAAAWYCYRTVLFIVWTRRPT